jgi:DNA invertase Pin-like site-specific DNA recombinase
MPAHQLIGYALVRRDEDPAPQLDALHNAGCHWLFIDTARRMIAPRPALDSALARAQTGDCLVVVTLARLTPSPRALCTLLGDLHQRRIDVRALDENIDTTAPDGDLVHRAAQAYMQASAAWAAEAAREGAALARARGHRCGRPPALTPQQANLARQMHSLGHSVRGIAHMLGAAPATVYRYLRPAAKAPNNAEDSAP